MLELLAVDYCVAPGEVDRIPRSGPLLIAANHPFPLLDGAILASLLAKVRGDAWILANRILASVPKLRGMCTRRSRGEDRPRPCGCVRPGGGHLADRSPSELEALLAASERQVPGAL